MSRETFVYYGGQKTKYIDFHNHNYNYNYYKNRITDKIKHAVSRAGKLLFITVGNDKIC